MEELYGKEKIENEIVDKIKELAQLIKEYYSPSDPRYSIALNSVYIILNLMENDQSELKHTLDVIISKVESLRK